MHMDDSLPVDLADRTDQAFLIQCRIVGGVQFFEPLARVGEVRLEVYPEPYCCLPVTKPDFFRVDRKSSTYSVCSVERMRPNTGMLYAPFMMRSIS